jgi:hypothetical protein
MSTVMVDLADLAALAELVCDRDHRTTPPTLENIDQSHALIIKMMGEHAGKFYAADDQSSEAETCLVG